MSDCRLEVRLLGPLEVRVDGADIELGGCRPRSVFAMLALDAGRVVSAERLIDEMWGGNAPEGAANTLQSHVSAIRRALGPARDRIETVARGYRLRVRAGEVDAPSFEAHVGSGAFADALALWNGTPLADLADEPFACGAVARLEELHLGALEQQTAADLAAGRDAEVIARLQRLVEEHPLRERFAAHLVVALYRSSRQSDALRVCDRLRRRLVEELGVDPSPEMQVLEQQVLDHSPALARTFAAAGPAAISPAATQVTSAFLDRLEGLVARLEAATGSAIDGQGAIGLPSGPHVPLLAWPTRPAVGDVVDVGVGHTGRRRHQGRPRTRTAAARRCTDRR
jgi:DNA-binding SARP family transcriptional activator